MLRSMPSRVVGLTAGTNGSVVSTSVDPVESKCTKPVVGLASAALELVLVSSSVGLGLAVVEASVGLIVPASMRPTMILNGGILTPPQKAEKGAALPIESLVYTSRTFNAVRAN